MYGQADCWVMTASSKQYSDAKLLKDVDSKTQSNERGISQVSGMRRKDLKVIISHKVQLSKTLLESGKDSLSLYIKRHAELFVRLCITERGGYIESKEQGFDGSGCLHQHHIQQRKIFLASEIL
ncbi:uncharacterized protein LOC144424303 [Styela clava]